MSNIFIQKPTHQPILVDVQQASQMLAICPRKLWQLTKDRQIPSLKIGKSVRYRVADLERWTQQQAIPQATVKEVYHGQH